MEYLHEEIRGIVKALQPVVHNDWDSDDFRTVPYVLKHTPEDMEADDEAYYIENVPVVSGNSLRGIGRLHFIRHTLEEVLELDIKEITEDIWSDRSRIQNCRFLSLLFYKGGVSPDGMKPKDSRAGAYEEAMKALPFLDLLGGIYGAHHIEGCLKIGFLVPRTVETQEFYVEKAEDKISGLITLEQLKNNVKTIMQVRSSLPADQMLSHDGEKRSMPWKSIALPAGTDFYFRASCDTKYPATVLAFRAFVGILAQHGFIGGTNRAGYGRVLYKLKDFNTAEAICSYDAYLESHKEEIVEGIRIIARDFKFDPPPADKKKAGK